MNIPDENKVAPSENVVLLCSGGFDSITLTVQMIWRRAQYRKLPVVAYLDTTIGAPANRTYVETICDHYKVPMMTIRTQENIEGITERDGLYSPQKHGDIFEYLKGRQISLLSRRFDSTHFFWASRADESDRRAGIMEQKYGEGTRLYDEELSLENGDRDVYHHAPYRHLTDDNRAKALKIPPNPLWWVEGPSDCGCGATAKFWENETVRQEGLRWFADKLDELEEIAKNAGHDGEQAIWGSVGREQKRALNDGQQTLNGEEVSRDELAASMACNPDSDCQKSSVPVDSMEEYVRVVA